MGLDMYLYASKFSPQVDYVKSSPGNVVLHPEFGSLMTLTKMENVASKMYGAYVEVVCAYWRKANSIHGWFVDNIQSGEDKCGRYFVQKSELETLRNLCQQTFDEKNPQGLLPRSGFYFGGDDVDQYYWGDIKNTIEQLNRILALPDIDDLSFYYQSSW